MIQSFGALYAGDIDLERVGYLGTPAEACNGSLYRVPWARRNPCIWSNFPGRSSSKETTPMTTPCDNREPDLLRMEGSVAIPMQPGRGANSRNTMHPRTIADEQGRVTRLWMPLVVLELELWRCELPFLFW